MTADRIIALIFLLVSLAYGHEAWVTMEQNLLPFELNMAFLPNSLPKLLSLLGAGLSFLLLISPPPPNPSGSDDGNDMVLGRWREYSIKTTLAFLGLMLAYIVALRPVGFLTSTFLFLTIGGKLLGANRWWPLLLTSALASGLIWWLVDHLLGIYLRPWFA